jgi:hypothetical protein
LKPGPAIVLSFSSKPGALSGAPTTVPNPTDDIVFSLQFRGASTGPNDKVASISNA